MTKINYSTTFYFFALVFFLAFSASVSVHSLLIDPLAVQELKVSDRSLSTRVQHFQKAFSRVLMLTTGSSVVLQEKDIQNAMNAVDRYVKQYSYFDRNGMLGLRVEFDRGMVERLMHSLKGYPKLRSERPITLLWLAVEASEEPELVGGALQAEMMARLEALAEERGLPMLLPLMDLIDKEFIEDKHIVNLEPEPLVQGGKRYSADLILAGKITQQGKTWHSQWMLCNENPIRWEIRADNTEDLLRKTVDSFGEKALKKYVVFENSGDGTAFRIAIHGIQSFDDYSKVLSYLEKLEGVLSAEVANVGSNETTFKIQYKQGRDRLVHLLNRGQLLIRVDNSLEPLGEDISLLRYQFRSNG